MAFAEETSFGQWLRQRRRMMDLTQQQLADQVGCARITLRRIESGDLKPSKELALILLEKLGAPQAEREAWLRFARGLSNIPHETTPQIISVGRSTNLPALLTSFVGREKDQAEIEHLIAKNRLVTLTGAGGIGKTRLSIQVASALLNDFPNGTWLVELAPLSDPALIAQTIASVFSLREIPGRTLNDLVTDYLRAKRALLILDNCEHLIEDCARLADHLLHTCPHLKILASSRESLGIAGETAYRVPSLSLPDPSHLTPDALTQYESVELFLERARAVQPHFALTTQNAPAVAQICQRLDGIPLAIELAVARVKVLTPEQIAARLDDRFRLLTGGSRAALPRQQTLRALIDWSYDLLPERERRLFWRLSVFAGGWTLEAAETVCVGEGLESEDILDLLTHLVDKSLVMAEEAEGVVRYRRLETIRQYAREKLLESGEAVTARNRHLDYFLRYAGKADEKIFGPEAIVWLDRLTAEKDNMRAALEWAVESHPETAMQLISALGEFWLGRNYETEGRAWCQVALDGVEGLPPLPAGSEAARERMAARARVLSVMSFMAIQQGDHHAGRAAAEEGVALARQTGDLRRLVRLLRTLGLATTFSGDPTRGLASVQEGEAISRQMGYKVELMGVLMALANIMMATQRDEARVRAYLEEGAVLASELGVMWTSFWAEFALARLAVQRGDIGEARMRAERIMAYSRERRDRFTLTNVQSELAHGLRQHGDLEEALALYRETIHGWQELGHRAAAAHQLECFALIAGASGHNERAAKLLGAAEALRELIGSPMTPVEHKEYEQAVSNVRAKLDEVAFPAAWAEGRAMTTEQAIEYALEENEV